MRSPSLTGSVESCNASRAEAWGPLLLVLLVAGLGAYQIGHKSFWLDEAYSSMAARLDGASLHQLVRTLEPNMSFYYLLLRAWRVFGDSDAAFRSLSLVAAALTVLPLISIGVRLGGRRAAITGGILFALSPGVIHYAQEARSYALTLLLATWATLAFLRALERPTIGRWSAYTIVGALALYSHLFAGFVLVGHALAAVAVQPSILKRPHLPAGYLATGLCAIPLVSWFMATPRRGTWFPPTTLALVWQAGVDLVGFAFPFMIVLAFVGIVALFRDRRGQDRSVLAVVLGSLLLPIAGMLMLAETGQTAFVGRYLLPVIAPLALLAGAGINTISQGIVRALMLGILLGLSALSLNNWYAATQENWRDGTAFIMAHASPEDAVVVHPAWARTGLDHYMVAAGRAAPIPRFPSYAWDRVDPFSAEIDLNYAEWADGRMPADDRIWLVERLNGQPAEDLDSSKWLPSGMAESYCVLASLVVPRVQVRLVERCEFD
jgi:mannosyltransferase